NPPFIIGTVGRMWPIKDHDNLVQAFALLRQLAPARILRLVIVGDGPERGAVEKRIVELNLTEQVQITGWRTDIAEILSKFDLFVLSSKAEGTPLTILEAMAYGLPVVSTQVGGIADLVVTGKTGELVPPNNPQALAKAMAIYLNGDLATRHGEAGRERVAHHFSIDRMIEAYRNLFEETWLRKNK
ncbi:MAG: glycosyltransferase, partial [Magnetococcales bacterium]|nr:glycosyltransferase [Magnetococcales bacterium]